MNTLLGLPILDHHKHLLQTGKEKYAWFTLVTALGSTSEEVEAQHRSTMIFFYECAAALYSAVYSLHKSQTAAKNGGSSKKKKGRS